MSNEDLEFDPKALDKALSESNSAEEWDFSDEDNDEESEVVELELDAYPVIKISPSVDQTSVYLESLLGEVKDDYEATGFGSYICVLEFQFIPNEADVKRYMQNVRSRLSKIRSKAPPGLPEFRLLEIKMQFFPGSKKVFTEYARVRIDIYNQIIAERRAASNAKAGSRNTEFSKLL